MEGRLKENEVRTILTSQNSHLPDHKCTLLVYGVLPEGNLSSKYVGSRLPQTCVFGPSERKVLSLTYVLVRLPTAENDVRQS